MNSPSHESGPSSALGLDGTSRSPRKTPSSQKQVTKKQAMVLEKSCVGSQSEDSISHMIADPPTICYANNNLFESMHINNQDGLEFVNWSSADDNHFETELEKIDSALLAHDESLLFQGLEVGASLSRSSDTTQHDWIPQYYDELVPGYKLVRSASIKVTNGMPIGDGIIHPLNLAESKALLGPNGVMRAMCPAWQRVEQRYQAPFNTWLYTNVMHQVWDANMK